jgi:ribosome-associated protein
LLALVNGSLDEDQAEELVVIDLDGKSSIADYMVIANGRSDRHVGAMAEHLMRRVKEEGLGRCKVEGLGKRDWVLLDLGDIIVHLFRPEVREFYNLEKMWSIEMAEPERAAL